MIKETDVIVEITYGKAKHYKDRGYTIPSIKNKNYKLVIEKNTKIKVDVKDLPNGSVILITAVCDNCQNEKLLKYRDYYKCTADGSNYYCRKCQNIKRFANAELKQREGALTSKNDYYWAFKENRAKELKTYIDEYKIIDNMQKFNNTLYLRIRKYDGDVFEFAKSLGYDPNDIISNHIDNRGDFNLSLFETYFANFLIANGMRDKYSRNDKICDSSNHKCDFKLNLQSGLDLYIEIWGHSKNDQSDRGIAYNKNRIIKEQIYKESGLVLINIEYEYFRYTQETMQLNFINALKPYINQPLAIVEWDRITDYSEYTEEQILCELSKITQGECLTVENLTTTQEGRRLFYYVQKVFGGISYFISKYNLSTKRKVNYWNTESIFNTYLYMVKTYGKILSAGKTVKNHDEMFNGFVTYIAKNGGVSYWKKKFIDYCEENNINLESE